MTSSTEFKTNIVDILEQFSQKYINHYQHVHSHLPSIEQDNDWESPCEVPYDNNENSHTALSTGEVFWRPVNVGKEQNLNFDNVESALELTLHADIKAYFTTLYSESLNASCEEGNLSLLFAWNKDDFQRLQENLIGHILMKQRLKQEVTVFFAVTDEEDMIISIDNELGAVWVERVGCKPHKKLANSLAQFLTELEPQVN